MIFPQFSKMQEQYTTAQKARSEVIATSDTALRKSKKAIFALHRDDGVAAQVLLKEASVLFDRVDGLIKKSPSLAHQGAYMAALEEYAEAQLFGLFLRVFTAKDLDKRILVPSVYFSGLSDVVGEMARFALLQATEGDKETVDKIYGDAQSLMNDLVEVDFTGPLRNKFDQTKMHFRKIEQIRYELSLRDHSRA